MGVVVSSECYVHGKANSYVQLRFEVKNESQTKWDKENYLRNYLSDDAHISRMKLPSSPRLEPGETLLLLVPILLPPDTEGKDKIIL